MSARRRSPMWTLARAAVITVAAASVIGVVLRWYSPTPLWLDEALTVNIAALPVPDLLAALRHDGSPPLYYLLLHVWMTVFGSSALAVRSLSSLLALLTLAVAWWVGRSFGGGATGRIVAALVATSPFLVRYATEARMYALVVLLTGLAVLALRRARWRPDLPRCAQLSVVSGLLMLTHYWTFFLLGAAAMILAGRALIGPDRPTDRRLLLALILGGLLFLPWVGSFLYQVRHTGTPWAPPPDLRAVPTTLQVWSGGSTIAATVMAVALTLAALIGVLPARWLPRRVTFLRRAWPAATVGAALLGASIGALVLAVAVSDVLGSGFAVRYTSAFVVPMLIAVALGLRRLPRRVGAAALVLLTVLGAGGALHVVLTDRRTQAGETAALLAASLQPGDAVVYCPDQLGPAVSRLLPAAVDQFVYPTLAPPALIDWVDYAQRNAASAPGAVAQQLDDLVSGSIWLVTKDGYLTFGDDCERLGASLADLRGGRTTVQQANGSFFENENVVRFAARGA